MSHIFCNNINTSGGVGARTNTHLVAANNRTLVIETLGKEPKKYNERGEDYFYDWDMFYDMLMGATKYHKAHRPRGRDATETTTKKAKTTRATTKAPTTWEKTTARVKEVIKTKRTKSRNIKSSACECGNSNAEFSFEISGGSEASPHEFPWAVRLISGCGGSKFSA